MASTPVTVANELLSTTLYYLAKDWVDARFQQSAYLSALDQVHGKGQPSEDGGSHFVQPLAFFEHSVATRIQTGYETINMAVTDATVPAIFRPAHTVQPIVISKDEEIKNKGEKAQLKILEIRQKQVMSAMHRNWVRRTLTGEPIVGYESWNHLNGITYGDGFLEENAVGAQGNSVGGVSKATYSGVVGWNNQTVNISNSFNANGLNAMDHLRIRCKQYAPGGDQDLFFFMSVQCFQNLKRSLRTFERYVVEKSTDGADGGKLMAYWDGIPVELESFMPTDASIHTSGVVSAYCLDLGSIHPMWDSEGFWATEDFAPVAGSSDTRAAKVRLYGQNCASHLGSSGLAYDGETF